MLLEQCLLEMKRCKAVEETFKKKKKRGASKHLHLEWQVRRFRFYTKDSEKSWAWGHSHHVRVFLRSHTEWIENRLEARRLASQQRWSLRGEKMHRTFNGVIKWRRSLESLWSEMARTWYLLVARRELGGLTAPLHPTPCALGWVASVW